MSAVDFDVLKLIPKMFEKMEEMQTEITELRQHLKPKFDLTKRAGVKAFLDISDSTIDRYIKDGTLKQGYHYHREIKNNKSIIIYVSGAIEEFKKEKTK
ncbi:hypothetical protein [Aliarcobacter butzleri]|uniref:hypothetical protein n=1 Tax=Aliarcobacter butzleri TaxID=28197 RepID=UPI001EDA0FC3|nr:hypothetical protein [Aliarcobacter butzleri]MCG3655965.1 hypothetical protein [Aliarcobacter butzleri]MCG3657963.1 hypothetical protein [Aliarcobacter butzleri]MDN5053837.1 hypothetical protein [Aliarcobacter butzleri]